MDPNATASLTQLLTVLGLGKEAAGILSLIAAAMGVVQVLLIWLPVATATSPSWYKVAYGVLSRVALNLGKNAPMPPNGLPAGGAVPTPPAMRVTVPAPVSPPSSGAAAAVLLVCGLGVSLMGCAAQTAGNVGVTTIDGAEVALTAAEQAATAYVQLPLCPQPAGTLCSVAATSAQIKSIARQADADLAQVKAGSVTLSVLISDINALTAATPATK